VSKDVYAVDRLIAVGSFTGVAGILAYAAFLLLPDSLLLLMSLLLMAILLSAILLN